MELPPATEDGLSPTGVVDGLSPTLSGVVEDVVLSPVLMVVPPGSTPGSIAVGGPITTVVPTGMAPMVVVPGSFPATMAAAAPLLLYVFGAFFDERSDSSDFSVL